MCKHCLLVRVDCLRRVCNDADDNSRVYLELRKALYGLRSASLAWYKHLSELVKEMGFHATDTGKSVFSREYEWEEAVDALVGVCRRSDDCLSRSKGSSELD